MSKIWQDLEKLSWAYSTMCNVALGPLVYWLKNPAGPQDPPLHASRFNSLGFLIMHLGIIEYYAAFRSSDRTLKSIVAGLVVAGDAYLIADRLRLLLSGAYQDRQEFISTALFSGLELVGMTYAAVRNLPYGQKKQN